MYWAGRVEPVFSCCECRKIVTDGYGETVAKNLHIRLHSQLSLQLAMSTQGCLRLGQVHTVDILLDVLILPQELIGQPPIMESCQILQFPFLVNRIFKANDILQLFFERITFFNYYYINEVVHIIINKCH
ncbi:hypothetical protein J6590_049809 [Homalodisca vitripennis]|nr:hypothetical protein J6590_049809 [Homalodisca vitripennis]